MGRLAYPRRADRSRGGADGGDGGRRRCAVLSAGDADATRRRNAARRHADRSLSLARGRQGPGGARLESRAARGNARLSRPRGAAGSRNAGRDRALVRPRPDGATVLQERARVPEAREARRARRRSSTRGSTAARCCWSIPSRIDSSGKTKIGAVVPNRDASRAAVGHLRTRHRDPGLPHRRHDDRRAGRPDDHRPPLVRMGARRGLRVRLPAHCRKPTRARSRIAATGTGSAPTARPTSS